MQTYIRKLAGPRWGDVIRKELKNLGSTLSEINRDFEEYKFLVKNYPKKFKLTNFGGDIHFHTMGTIYELNVENVSPYAWVSHVVDLDWAEKEIDYSI